MPESNRPLLLYVTDTVGMSGAEGYLLTLLQHADRRRFRVGLLLPERPATRPLVDAARDAGAQVAFLDHVHVEGLSLPAVLRTAAAFRVLKPAIAHFVLPAPRRCAEAILGAALARVPRRIATFQLVTPVPRFGRVAGLARSLNRRLQYATLHRGVAVSQGNRRLLIEEYGFPSSRLTLIPNGVDTERFRPRPPDPALREAWGIPAGAPLLGVVARLAPSKGHRVLLDALPHVWVAHPDAHLLIVGAGEREAELRSQAGRLERPSQVHFIGQQADITPILAALDVFVLPSFREGLAFAVLEAMAAACAIVATAVDGTVEAIEPGSSGLLVPPGDPHELASAIARLLADPDLRRRVGQAARERVAAQFDQRAMVERTYALYE